MSDKREASLVFRIEDVEQTLATLERVEGALRRIHELSTLPSPGSMGGAISAPTGTLPAEYVPSGRGATLSAADPTIPLVAPPQGSPQQQRIGLSHNAQDIAQMISLGLITGQRAQDLTQSLGLPIGGYAPAPPVSPGWGWSTSGYTGGSGVGLPPAPPSVTPPPTASGGGGLPINPVAQAFIGGLPGGASILRLAGPVGVASAVAGTLGKYGLNAWDVSIARGAAVAGGELITPEMGARFTAQRNVGWIPMVGPRLMQPISASLSLHEGIRGLDEQIRAVGGGESIEDLLYEQQLVHHWTGATMSRRTPVSGARDRRDLIARAIALMPELARSGGGDLLAGDIDRLYRKYQRGASSVATDLLDLYSRPEFDFLRLETASNPGASTLDSQSPYSRRAAETMSTTLLMSGDRVGYGVAAKALNGPRSREQWGFLNEQARLAAFGRGYTEWQAFHESTTGFMESFGYSGENIFGERMRAQSSAGAAAIRLIRRAHNAEEVWRANPSPTTWATMARIKREAAEAAGAYGTAGRQAGDKFLGYSTGILDTEASLAELEGRSPAEPRIAQAAWYRDIRVRPEAYFGAGVRLNPREQAEYYLRERQAQIGGIEAERGWAGGIATSRQLLAESRLSGMEAGGAVWSSEMNTQFEVVSKHIAERIATIDKAIESYAANGIKHGATIEALQAERGELGTSLKQLQARAFQTAYSTLQATITGAQSILSTGMGRITTLGRSPEELGPFFSQQTHAMQSQVGLAERKHADAVRMFGPDSVYAIQTAVDVEQARAQQATLPFQQIEQKYGLASRVPVAYGVGFSTAASVTTISAGSTAALPETMAALGMLQKQAGLSGARLSEIMRTPGAGPALIAEAWQSYQQAQSGVAQGWMGAAQYSASPAASERLELAQFGQHVLQSTMGARGSVRAMARQRMGAAEEMIRELMQQRDAVLSQTPANMREAVSHRFNQQLRGLQMERVSAEQELQQGWLERVVSASWNMPSNADVVMNEFSYSGAVMKHGIKARHLGSTSADLPGYQDEAMGYATYGGSGKFGTPRSFLENAMSEVSDTPYTRPPLGTSGGAPGTNPLLAPGGSSTLSLDIRVVVVDQNGSVLGTQRHVGPGSNEFGISIMRNSWTDSGLGQSV